MRHFTTVSRKTFSTITLDKGDRMFGNPASLRKKVLTSLALALECPIRVCEDFMSCYISEGMKAHDSRIELTPSERQVIAEFTDFYLHVQKAWDESLITHEVGSLDEVDESFVYSNINSGHSVVWTVFLERDR